MADKKRKSGGGISQSRKKDGEFNNKKRKNSMPGSKKRKEQGGEKRRWRGPRLPNAFRKEHNLYSRDDESEEIEFDDEVVNDLYEYEEAIPEEESKKNRRFDPVDNYEFELPNEFEDWKVSSDDEDEDAHNEDKLKGDDVDDEDEDAGRHVRMLEQITGLPSDSFGGKKKKNVIISEAYPESEYNPSGDIIDGDGRISMHDLLNPLQDKPGYSKIKKSLHRLEKKSMPTLIPLPKSEKERVERKAVYEQSKKDITKWELLVKRNREAPTLYFDEDVDLGFSTIAAIASEFEPRSDFEKKMASLVNQSEVVEAHKRDGARLLELNEVSIEDVKERQARLGKMRSLLFRHELKAKRIKKIKSKTYHRLLKKDRIKAAEASIQVDPAAAKELAMMQEKKRAEERAVLKHKNNSKWAKRILRRGLDAQDEATRAAFSEQLNLHASLTRKMNSIKENSSSDDSSDSDESEDMSAGSDEDISAKIMKKAKEKTLQVLEEDEELPKSGVLSLPFMVRGLKKKKEAADEEARLALEEYDSSLSLSGNKSVGSHDKDASNGRRVFGVPKKTVNEASKKEKTNNYYGNSDSDSDVEANEDDATQHDQFEKSLREPDIDPSLLREEFEPGHGSVYEKFENAEDHEPKINYEIAYLASDSWKKIRRSSDAVKGTEGNNNAHKSDATTGLVVEYDQNSEQENDEDSDTDSDEKMVDGILSSGPKISYKLPSQAELIQRAFAGDNVEEDFEKDKDTFLNEENPEPEKPVLIPGWGQWTDVQKKTGLPSWMLQEHESAKKQRLESLKKRKDAHLSNVIISEKLDKKAEKLHTKTLPYPYTSQEVFEQSIRMPIGPEFNPVTAVGALNRPEVMKRPGIIIKPIEYEDVSVHERNEPHKGNAQKQKKGKANNQSKKRKTWV